jgi:hypothetical protein
MVILINMFLLGMGLSGTIILKDLLSPIVHI